MTSRYRARVRYVGQWDDEESGLHYNLNRYYDSETGAYLCQDPIGLEGGSRTHGYVPNPSLAFDPLGLAVCSLRYDRYKAYRDAGFSVQDAAKMSKGRALAPYWPPNNGVWGQEKAVTLQPKTLLDRYGYEGGTYVSPAGTPYGARALPPGSDQKPYNVYRVIEPIDNVLEGKIAPWFGELGFGTQYKLPKSVADLLESGHLERVNRE